MQFRIAYGLIAIFISTFFIANPSVAQSSSVDALVRPIDGARMVVGDGEVPDYTLDCFLYLCAEPAPNVIVINLDGNSRIDERRCKDRGAGSVHVMNSIPKDTEALTLQLLNADGVWIEGKPVAIAKHSLLISLLKNVTKRNGVIAVGSSAVALVSQLDENDEEKRLQSPFAKCQFHFGTALNSLDGVNSHLKVHWLIPDSAALVVQRGRWIAGYGSEDIRLLVKEYNGWPERSSAFECVDVFGPGGYPGYSLDLLSWIRSANDRGRPVFPAAVVSAPVVESGTLFLHGGSRIERDVMEEFVRIAGGKAAPIVCIPSASRFDRFEEPDSYSAGELQEMGCSNVTIMHTDDPWVADQSEEFAQLLKNAKGVWIDGGRTFRFMDCYENTQVPELLAEVLKRGGVVGGSSAGCQVPSEFLVRGNPRSNRDIAFDGYYRGLGLLKGVIIDAHFLQRERHEPLLELMKQHPQFLGIGIDESTALIVKGDRGTVLGEAAVSFYDLTGNTEGEFSPTILKAGQSYNLKLRKTTQSQPNDR